VSPQRLFRRAGWPKHATKWLRQHLRAEANALRGLYGVPVYLVGSALFDANPQPRDWDIRLTLPDDRFKRRYGDAEQWEFEGGDGHWTAIRWRWSDDCVKQSQRLTSNLGVLVDVQIYPERYAKRFRGRHRLRLDTRRVREGN
jgi:hypothetical protein